MFQIDGINTLVTQSERPFITTSLNTDKYYILDLKDLNTGAFLGFIYKTKGADTVPVKPGMLGKSYNIFASNIPGNTTELHYALGQTLTDGGNVALEAIIGEPADVFASTVAGKVQIDGTPARRIVRAFTYDSETMTLLNRDVTAPRPLGETYSDPDTGDYELVIESGYLGEVFIVAFDDYGQPFSPDLVVSVGDRVHPSTPNGHVFECTGAGTLPTNEPNWTVDTEAAQLYGTAAMIAKPFYRPMVHGPVIPEVIEPAPEP